MTDEPQNQEGNEDVKVVSPPAKIHLKSGEVFTVSDVDAWGYVDWGIVAEGQWGFDGKVDVLIPYAEVHHIEFDYDALARFEEQEEDNDGAE